MEAWTPIAQLADELRIDLAAPGGSPPPLRAPAMPELQFRSRADEIVYAGFWRRFAARVLDHFIVFIPVYVVVVFAVGGLAALSPRTESGNTLPARAILGVYLLPMVANFFYFSLMESSPRQATFGKMALGIKVTDADGRRLNFSQAAVRWFAAALSYLTVYIGFIMAGFTEQKRALHDMLASTLVVDQWAYTDRPERQQREMSGCLIAVIVVFLGGLFIVPIFAAIAISQYQDYVLRAQVSEASSIADGVKTAFAEYAHQNGRMPTSNAEAGLAGPGEIRGSYVSYVNIVKPGRIEVGYSSSPPNSANSVLNGKHLYFDAKIGENSVEWTCHSDDLKQKWCPSSCTCSG